MGYMNEFPHSRMFDSDLREILEMFVTVKNLPKEMENFKNEMLEKYGTLENFVKSYFENLDVQEEVNNKLEAMYLEGKLILPYVTPEMYGAVGDGVSDDSEAIVKAINSGKTVYLRYGAKYYIAHSILITKTVNFICDGSIVIGDNVTAFIVGDENNSVQEANFKIKKAYGNGRESNSILFSIRSAKYNKFRIDYAENMGKVIEIKPLNSCGENQFYPHLWYGTNIAFHIMGADTWENAQWAEGSQIIAGFIAGSKYGIKIEANVKYSGMLVTTGIDNADVEGSYDYYNLGTESPVYNIANLLLFRFIRLDKCVFKNIDTYWDANLKLKLTGEIETNASLVSKTSENSKTTINGGQVEIFNSNAPYIDLKRNVDDDYSVRLTVNNDVGELSHKASPGLKITKNGIGVYRSGIANVAGGSTKIAINHNYAINTVNYLVFITTTWGTNTYISVKNKIGFEVSFETPPPETSEIYWMVLTLE